MPASLGQRIEIDRADSYRPHQRGSGIAGLVRLAGIRQNLVERQPEGTELVPHGGAADAEDLTGSGLMAVRVVQYLT